MSDPNRRLSLSQVAADLQQATHIAGEHGVHTGLKNVVNLALSETFRHFRLGEVVTTGRAAADFRLIQRDKFQLGNHLQQLPRLPTNLLPMAEVAGIVINGPQRQGMLGL